MNNPASPVFDAAMLHMELIREMAIEDGWSSFDDCLAEAPQAFAIFNRHATAALRVLKRHWAKN